MFFNFGKCKHVHYISHDENFRYTMRYSDELNEIQKVTSEKDLGVLVDNKLLFREHIAKKVGTANRNLGLIFKTFEFMDKDMFLNLYKSLDHTSNMLQWYGPHTSNPTPCNALSQVC